MSDGLDIMKQRINFHGEDRDGRIVRGKYDTFKRVLNNSYQGEWITLDKGTPNERRARCLINPSRLTEQFDKKVISIDYCYGMQEGDVFYWDRTDRYWIVNLQQHTEEAYFRGIITRCNYELEIDGEFYWTYLRGPEEKDIAWRRNHDIYFNDLNYTMKFDITKNSKTIDYFSRFKKVKIKNTFPDVDTEEEITVFHNWEVVATDKYSSDRIITVYVKEASDNPEEDAMIKPVEKEVEDNTIPYIEGPQFVNPYDSKILYTIKNDSNGVFTVNSNKVKIMSMDNDSCLLEILSGKSMSFTLSYEVAGLVTATLVVNVKSL